MSGTIAAFLAGSAATACYGIYKKQCEKDTSADTDVTVEGSTARGGLGSIGTRSVLQSSAGATAKQQAGFLSDLLAQLWSYINTAAANTIKESVEPQFKTLPGPLSTLHFIKVDLGDVPLRLDNIVVHEVDKETNTLQFDLDVLWDGNCNIQLKANYLGSFGVKSVKLFGRLSILLKPLVETLSIVQAVQISFINPPEVDLDFVGMANIADMKMIKRRIDTLIQDILKGQMVLPKRMLTKLDMGASFFDIYQPPIGICRMTLANGSGFKVEERTMRKNDVPDCFAILAVGNRTAKSKTVPNSTSPVWNETMDFVLCDHDQIVHMDVFDEDNGTMDSDDFLGKAEATVGDILLNGGKRTFHLQSDDKKRTGAAVNVTCEMLKLTSDLTSLSTATTSPSEICGMVTVFITQAFKLPVEKEQVSAFVKVSCGKQSFVTATVADAPGLDSLNPFFDSAFHVLLTADLMQEDGKVQDVCLELMNNTEDSLGSIKIDHAALDAAPGKILTDKRPIGDKGAMIEFRVVLAGVEGSTKTQTPTPSPAKPAATAPQATGEPAAAPDTSAVPTPTFVPEEAKKQMVRVTVVKGTGFKVQKTGRFKKNDVPDVYCIVKYGSSPTAFRTATIKNNVAPEWNESTTYPFLNHSQILNIDVMDEDSGRRTDDDFLGVVRVTVGKILLAGGKMDVEIEAEGKPTGSFLTLQCDLIEA